MASAISSLGTTSPVRWPAHAYQREAVRFLLEHGAAGLFLDPGLGKTAITLAAFKVLKDEGLAARLLVITPLRAAYLVWPAEAEKWTEFAGLRIVVLHGSAKAAVLFRPNVADVYVINPEGLTWLLRQGAVTHNFFDVLCVDECFPAGTMITLADGGVKAIEHIVIGDVVKTSSGARHVTRVGKRSTIKLVELTMSNGVKLSCTPEHPIFTTYGWFPARLTKGKIVYADVDLSDLQANVQSPLCDDVSKWSQKMLLAILRSEVHVGNDVNGTTPTSFNPHERCRSWSNRVEQRMAVANGTSQEDVCAVQKTWAYVQTTWWKWTRAVTLRGLVGNSVAKDVYLELSGKIGQEAARLSYKLQSRFWESDDKDGDRSRWWWSSQRRSTREGQKENRQAKRIRVASVSYLKFRRPQNVFNLVVEGCPHFFANGLIVHNSSKFKNTRTERFKLLRAVLGCFKRRWILTGSPAANGLLDLFGQVFILDLGRALGRFITHYRLAYFAPQGYGGYTWTPQVGAEKRIYAALAPLVLRMAEKDYLKLPPLTTIDVPIELPPAAMKLYREMEHQLFIALDDGEARAVNRAVALMKARQICNGGIYLDEDGEDGVRLRHAKGTRPWAKMHDEKTTAVVDLVDELGGQPCLVAYEFDHDLARLAAALPSTATRRVVVAAEATTQKRLVALQAAWDRGEIQVLLVQPQSISHSLNLQAGGRAVVLHSLTYNYEDYDQLIRRIYRQGQRQRVFIYRLVARATVDEVITAVLAAKRRGQQALFTALRAYRARLKARLSC